jgi:monofunctional biosynthetic peptidoglycan transglycosylase
VLRQAWRLVGLFVIAALSLQVYFALRIALMAVVDPQSTSFQRSEAWRMAFTQHRITWSQSWVDYPAIAQTLKRAVVASEDAGFSDHGGVDWDSIEKARERNQKAQARAERQLKQKPGRTAEPRLRGGSTISQQLSKNLFLSGERTIARKAQELLITLMMEGLLSKQRILEIYLNNVEWGEGLFGAQAAARHYFRVDAAKLGPEQAARLAVMLPAPKRFEKQPSSAYVLGRAAVIVARMPAVEVP